MYIDFSIFCNDFEEFIFYKPCEEPYFNFYGDQLNFFVNSRSFYNQTNYSFFNNFLISNFQLTTETEGDSFNFYSYIDQNNYKDEINDIINKNLNLPFIILENENGKENKLNEIQKKKKAKIKLKRINIIEFNVKFKYKIIECSSKYPILIKKLYKFICSYLNSKRYFSKIGVINKYLNKSFINYNIRFYLKKIICKRKYILIKLKFYDKKYHFINKYHKKWYKNNIGNGYFKLKIRYN